MSAFPVAAAKGDIGRHPPVRELPLRVDPSEVVDAAANNFIVRLATTACITKKVSPHASSPSTSNTDWPSTWSIVSRQTPDEQIGIVHINTDKQLDNVLALVSWTTTGRVGLSARFDDLRETAQALRFARVMLGGRRDPGTTVAVFDGSILATAAVSAPEVMVKLVTPTLQGFAELADNEREILFETFRVWLENDGSLSTVGELLFCHPTTVRYRLHRIAQRTGRSLSRPRDIAKLCLAFEVRRRLLSSAPNRNGRKPVHNDT